MDSFYCLVRIPLNEKISLYCIYNNDTLNLRVKTYSLSYPICFTAESSEKIILLLSRHSIFTLFSINHALYLGKELYKAELSLLLKQYYLQD